jgi:hypothetical protein
MPAKPEAAAGGRAASAADPFEPTSNLSDGEAKQLAELKARDRDVKAHEAAHKASGGQYAGSASFSYQNGPDGRQYAIGGEVPIDAGVIAGDPDATIRKMEQVRAAALAPAEPSGQDRSVAALATAAIAKARSEAPAATAEAAIPAGGGVLIGSLTQSLAELQQADEAPSGVTSRAPDLSAYATRAYRQQASPGQGVTG